MSIGVRIILIIIVLIVCFIKIEIKQEVGYPGYMDIMDCVREKISFKQWKVYFGLADDYSLSLKLRGLRKG